MKKCYKLGLFTNLLIGSYFKQKANLSFNRYSSSHGNRCIALCVGQTTGQSNFKCTIWCDV